MNNINPSILLALASAVFLGVGVTFWQMTLQKMSSFQLLILFGVTYFIVGLIGVFFEGNGFNFSIGNLRLAIPTSILYATAVVLCGFALGHPQSKMTITAAIIAAYPVVTAILDVVIKKQSFSLKEIIFLLMTTGGIIGFSLSGKS